MNMKFNINIGPICKYPKEKKIVSSKRISGYNARLFVRKADPQSLRYFNQI